MRRGAAVGIPLLLVPSCRAFVTRRGYKVCRRAAPLAFIQV